MNVSLTGTDVGTGDGVGAVGSGLTPGPEFFITDNVVTDTSGIGADSNIGRSDSMMIAFATLGALGCPVNLFVIFVILRSPAMRKKPFNILISHQSLIDALVCASLFFTQFFNAASDLSDPTGLGAEIYCRIWAVLSLMWTFINLSANNLVVMTIERYLAITKPLKYDEHKVRKRLPFIFVSIWMLSFAIMSPDYFMSEEVDGVCALHVFDTVQSSMIIFMVWIVFYLFIPATVMIFSYVHMFLIIRRNSSSGSGDSSGGDAGLSTSKQREKTLKKVQVNVIQTCAVICLFFVCTMTFLFVIDALIIFKFIDNFGNDLWNASVILTALNSCVNPFIYTIRYPEFQNEVRVMCKSADRSRSSYSSGSSTDSTSKKI